MFQTLFRMYKLDNCLPSLPNLSTTSIYPLSDNSFKLRRRVLSLTPDFFISVSLLGQASAVSLSAYIHKVVYTDFSDALKVGSSITFRVTMIKGLFRRSIPVRHVIYHYSILSSYLHDF